MIAYYAFCELPNSRILPMTVVFNRITCRCQDIYVDHIASASSAKYARIAFVAAIWFSVFTLIFAVPSEIARLISFVGIPVPPCKYKWKV